MTVSAPVRRLLAAALVAQPLLLGINATFHPPIEFTPAGVLAGAAESPAGWYAVHLVAALGALLTIPAVIGLRTLVRERGRLVANLGVGAGIVAAAVLPVAFGIEASVLRLAVTSGLDTAGQLAIAEAHLAAPEALAVPVGVLAFTLAGLLLATALLAARAVPRWQAVLYLVGILATLAGGPGSPLGPLAFASVTLAAAFLAGHIIRSDDTAEHAPRGGVHVEAATPPETTS